MCSVYVLDLELLFYLLEDDIMHVYLVCIHLIVWN